MNICKSTLYGSILFMSLASEMNFAEPIDCSNGFCEISNSIANIQVNSLTAPAIIDDGFGFKQKTLGGLQTWKVNGVNHIFFQWKRF